MTIPETIARAKELSEKASEYLAVEGLFNPELMEHDKVRDMVMEFRTLCPRLARELKEAREALIEVMVKLKSILALKPDFTSPEIYYGLSREDALAALARIDELFPPAPSRVKTAE